MTTYNFAPEDTALYAYKCNQHVLLNKANLKHVRGFEHLAVKKTYVPPDRQEWQPRVNAYYEYAEDYDAVSRIPHVVHEEMGDAPVANSTSSTSSSGSLTLTNEAPIEKRVVRSDVLTERRAQIAYMETPPKCFVILGKPDVGEERLGRLLADYWKCVYLHPEVLVKEEIASGSRAGQCIEFNLRCGRAIGVDVIIRLLEKRLTCESIKHRGFVLCGFPLIANDLLTEDPMSSESAIFNVQEIFEELIDEVVETVAPGVKHGSRTSLVDDLEREIGEEEEKDVDLVKPPKLVFEAPKSSIAVGSIEEQICFKSNYHADNTNQIQYVLDMIASYDYLIIYLKCPNEEVVNIRQDNRVDAITYLGFNIQKERAENILMYPSYDAFDDPTANLPSLNQRRSLKVLRHFPACVRIQLERYVLETQLVIEKFILRKNPLDLIKLDPRMPPQKMFNVLRMRLKVLGLTPVLLPKLLISSQVEFDEPGEGHHHLDDESAIAYEDLPPEETYHSICQRKALGPLYKWNLSEWKYGCPVIMKEGFQEDGQTRYAVQFMNSIFFLRDEQRCEAFMRNPRPYLLPPQPLTLRKVFVIGPRLCGKTITAQCLRNFTGATIIDFVAEYHQYSRKLLSGMEDYIRRRAYRACLDNMKRLRRETCLNIEAERRKKLAQYLVCIRANLIELRDAYIATMFDDMEFTSFPKYSFKQKTDEVVRAEAIIERLSGFAQAFDIHSAADCEAYLADESLIIKRLPPDMQERTVFHFEVVSSSSNYVQMHLSQEIAQIEEEVIASISTPPILARCLNEVLTRYNSYMSLNTVSGWILDGFPVMPEVLRLVDRANVPQMAYVFADSSNGVKLMENSRLGTSIGNVMLDELFLKAGISQIAFESDESYGSSLMSVRSLPQDRPEVIQKENEIYLGEVQASMEEGLKQMKITYQLIDIGPLPFQEVLLHMLEAFKTLHAQEAHILNPNERAHEMALYGEVFVDAGEGADDDDEGTEQADNNIAFRENRRLGTTADYDAVAFNQYHVLWKGKDDFAVSYMNRMWLFANETTMNEFALHPVKYAKHILQNVTIPPTRICIVGNWRIGKTTQARLLCKRLGFYYLDFESEMKSRIANAEGSDDDEDHDETEQALMEVLGPYWNDPNKARIGFVLDGFPSQASHVHFMCDKFLIPDCVMELYMDSYQLNDRLVEILMSEWRVQIASEKESQRARYDEEIKIWQETRDAEKARLMEERRRERYARSPIPGVPHEDEEFREEGSIDESLMSVMSYQEAEDEKEVERLLNEDYPEPQFEANWETEEAARERLQLAVEEPTNNHPEVLTDMKLLCKDKNIPWHAVNASKDKNKVYNLAMQDLMQYMFRNQSFFERAYDISVEMAEKLLETGYYFISRFGRMCPVQAYENYNPLHMFINKEATFQLFPMIYTHYIYFIAGAENREKFKKNILKYIQQTYSPSPPIRSRISVIGPPRCGKTTICERFAGEFSLEHISIGKAVRRVLKYMPSSVLAQRVRRYLGQGEEVPNDLTIQCVEAMTFEARAVALGYVLDGCPNIIEEVRYLAQLNLIPHLVIDLEASLNYIYEYMDVFGPTHRPEFSKKFIKYRFDDWSIDQGIFREWIDKEYQNIAKVSVMPSKWKTWHNAKELMLAVINEIKHYYKNAHRAMVLRVANMLVTPYEYLCRQSCFKNFCPLCLFYNNSLLCGGSPPDRTGLMYYDDKFYWLCAAHETEFEDDPDRYLGPNIRHSLPTELPELRTFSEMPPNVFYNGNCVVCIAKGKPDKVLNPGALNLAVEYRGKVYLFDTQECYNEFYRQPHAYSSTTTNFPTATYPNMDMQSLPTMGMLEQYVAKQVIRALIEVDDARPSIPGLTLSQSAVICLGLLLKIHNPNTPDKYVEMYKASKRNTIDYQLELRAALEEYKGTLNPYVHYEEPLPELQYDYELLDVESMESLNIRGLVDDMLGQIDYDSHRSDFDETEIVALHGDEHEHEPETIAESVG